MLGQQNNSFQIDPLNKYDQDPYNFAEELFDIDKSEYPKFSNDPLLSPKSLTGDDMMVQSDADKMFGMQMSMGYKYKLNHFLFDQW